MRPWTYAFGHRGHILTESRACSTTYAALRAERSDHVGRSGSSDTITDSHWCYAGSDHSPGGALIAAGIAEDLAFNRELSREAAEQQPGGSHGWHRGHLAPGQDAVACRARVTPAHPVRTASTSTDELQDARLHVRHPRHLGSSDKRPGSGCHRPGAGRPTRSRHASCKHTPVFGHRDRCPDSRHTLAACLSTTSASRLKSRSRATA
ncbi:replication initiator [Streptomyces sp. NPDC005859]|uniref:replication initiator n=1 Tax=Streptomyces sp. NPDC005859 TaxID=3157170 RepID=UPI0033DC347F